MQTSTQKKFGISTRVGIIAHRQKVLKQDRVVHDHTYRIKRKKWHRVPNYINYRLKSEVSIMLCCQLCSTCYTTLRIKNCLKSTSAIHVYHIKVNNGTRPSYIYYHLKSEVFITLHCLLCSTCYTAVQIKNCLKST